MQGQASWVLKNRQDPDPGAQRGVGGGWRGPVLVSRVAGPAVGPEELWPGGAGAPAGGPNTAGVVFYGRWWGQGGKEWSRTEDQSCPPCVQGALGPLWCSARWLPPPPLPATGPQTGLLFRQPLSLLPGAPPPRSASRDTVSQPPHFLDASGVPFQSKAFSADPWGNPW